MNKIALVGGGAKLSAFLAEMGADFEKTTLSAAVRDESFGGMLLLPDYASGEDFVPEMPLSDMELLAKRKKEGLRVYSENYLSLNSYSDSVFAFSVQGSICRTNNQALCAMGGLQYILGGERIIQASDARYFPGSECFADKSVLVREILLSMGRYYGTSQVKTLEVPDAMPVLIRSGSFLTSAISFTEFDNVNMRPNCRFKKLFGYIFSFVTGIEKEVVERAFEVCYPPIKTRFSVNDTLPEDEKTELYKTALSDAVKWHFTSGMILGEHGEEGAVEMVLSNNAQRNRNNRRVDSGFYTGWLLYAAGKYFNNSEWMRTGKNVFDYFLTHAQLSGGVVDGMFDWFYNKYSAPNDIYSIDLGRDGIALCNMYELTGDAKILDAIKRLAEAVFGWIDGDRLYNVYIPYGKIGTEAHLETGGTCTPAIYGELSSFMAMSSRILGDEKYIDKMVPVCDMLVKNYPDYDYYGHTTSSRIARLLLTLLPVHISGKRDYSEIINESIDYLDSLRTPCGGIYSEDNITFEKMLKRNGECGITTPWDNDRISDQLYCVNNALVALSLLTEVSCGDKVNKEKGLKLYKSLLDYIVKIQIVSDDGRFMGGWMRAYCMNLGEYYGLDADSLWSSYCIMAGWTMGIIPLSLLSELDGRCPYV